MFGSVGEDVWVNQPLTLAVGSTVTIGEGTYINSGLILVDDYEITIGKGVLIGTGVTLCTTGHPIDPERRGGSSSSLPSGCPNALILGKSAVPSHLFVESPILPVILLVPLINLPDGPAGIPHCHRIVRNVLVHDARQRYAVWFHGK